MQQAKLCVVLLTLMLGWHGLPGPGFCADYYQHEDFGEKRPGDVVSFTVTPPGTVISGWVINPGGFLWFGGPATWTGTIPTNFAGVHNGLFRGTWKIPPRPGPGPSRELTWEADTKAVVFKLTLQMDEYLGISMVDPVNTPVDSETATATLTPAISVTYSWTLNSGITHFDPDPGSGNTATIKEQGVASGSYKNEKVRVSAKGLSAETNFTVVRIDIQMQGLDEAEEEVVGGLVCLNSDDDNANGVPDLSEEPVQGENDLVELTITLYPSDLPANETVSITGSANLYEDPEKEVNALSSYPVSRFPLTLWVEGKNVSGGLRDKEVMVTHDASGAKDKVKYTVLKVEIAELDRVPPSKTRQVNVTTIPSPLPAGHSISLICEADPGTSGSATVSPDTISETTEVTITGGVQSGLAEKDHIKLKALCHGQVCAPEAFTVCAHPIDFVKDANYSNLYLYGFRVWFNWNSDSDDVGDLDKCWFNEIVPPPTQKDTPPFYFDSYEIGAFWMNPGHGWDDVYCPAAGVSNYCDGYLIFHQQYRWQCYRCGYQSEIASGLAGFHVFNNSTTNIDWVIRTTHTTLGLTMELQDIPDEP